MHIITAFIIILTFLPAKRIFEAKLPIYPQQDKILKSSKYVCLTFDDGPHFYYTKKIVDILKEYNVKATFFLVGKQAQKYPQLVNYILSHPGCKIANHTFSHKNLRKLTQIEIEKEIILAHRTFLDITKGEDSLRVIPYLRPPGGNFNENLIKILQKHKFKLCLWSVFSNDLKCKNKDELIKNISHQLDSSKEIILLHSGNQITLEALPELIVLLRDKGYDFINIDEIEYELYNVN
ncbi:MAG: polysaccharide deacetylase family protein [Endomicrobiia bacterium]